MPIKRYKMLHECYEFVRTATFCVEPGRTNTENNLSLYILKNNIILCVLGFVSRRRSLDKKNGLSDGRN